MFTVEKQGLRDQISFIALLTVNSSVKPFKKQTSVEIDDVLNLGHLSKQDCYAMTNAFLQMYSGQKYAENFFFIILMSETKL